MNNEQVSISKLLNEYNKCSMSFLIKKDYDFNILRNMLKEFSEETETIEYKEEWTDGEIMQAIKKFIDESIYGKKISDE